MSPTLLIDVSWARLRDLRRGGLGDLLPLHWEEVADSKAQLPLDVDWEMLERVERAGGFRALGAYADEELVGFLAFEVVAPRTSRSTRIALEVGFYVLPEHRGMVALRLVATAESLLRLEGVQVVRISSRPGAPRVGDLLDKLGYRPTEVIHTKVL